MIRVFTNGCFRYPHSGHRYMMVEARTFGDVLIVAVNTDASLQLVRPGQSFLPFTERKRIIESWGLADEVLPMESTTPLGLLQSIGPEILWKGGSTTDIVGEAFVLSYGGRVIRGSLLPGFSSTLEAERVKHG